MGKGSVFIASSGARDKKTVIFKEIISICPNSDYSSVLYITPAAFSLVEARRQFFPYLKNTHKKKVYIPFQSFTIKTLCIHLYGAYREKNIISDRIEPMILCEVLGEKNIGYAHVLSGLLSKIRHYILDKQLHHIKDDIKSQIFEEKTMTRAVKAIETLEKYERELEEKGLIDFEGAIKESIFLIREHLNPSILVLDGFFDPTPLELEVIKALIEKTDMAYVLVEEDAEFLQFFESLKVNKKWEMRTERLRKMISPREKAGYYPYPSMEDEVEGIARGVKALIIKGIRANEIIVSFPQLSRYLPTLKRVFQKHAIPVNIGEYDLSSTKPFIALEDMITSIEDDYPRNEFLSFLTSAHFPKIPKIIKEWAVSFSNKAGVIKGRQAWLSIKETILNSTEDILKGQSKKIIDEFQREIKKILDTLEKLREVKDLSSFVDELEAVLDRFGFFDSLKEPLTPYREDISQGVENILSELRHFAEIYGLKETNIEGAGFYLRHLLKGINGRDENVDGVRVLPIELAAGVESKAMFCGGMIEGDFPSKPEIDPILPEKVKKALGLPFLEYYLDRQKRYFKRLLNISSDEPYFSYPMANGDNIFLPSPFLDWQMCLIPPQINIFTEEDVLVREGALKQKDLSQTLWDGKLPWNKDIKNILMKRFGPKTFFRVTDIDAYRRCPLRFYIERVLDLEIEKPPEFEVEAMLWGRLAHKTMEYLYKDGDIELDDLDKRLFRGLKISLKQFPIGSFWSRVAREIFQRLLPMLKEQETDMRMQGFTPYMVEKTLKVTVNDLRLKGKIDRVDSKTQNSVILLDYKTGSIDKDSLQLPLYACMWQKENGGTVERVGFYSLKDGYVDWYPKKISMEEFIQVALLDAEELIQNMRKGIFEPIPFKEECRYCGHSNLCKGRK